MKQVLKFDCLGSIAIFVLLLVIGIFAEPSEAEVTPETVVESKEVSKEDAELRRVKDSIRFARQAEARQKLKSFRSNTDDFEGNTFYRDNRAPAYADVNFIYPYIGEKDNNFWLRVKFQYAADDWLFIRSIKIKTDNASYEIPANFQRDNDSTIWEWYDMSPDAGDIRMLRDIALSKEAKLRYVGQQYHHDRIITSKEKDIIKKTLEVYENL